jgi:predicted acylesterase/phospholipase RssA
MPIPNRTVDRTEPALRIALIVPGAVSLGAYEAGALTALLRLIRASEGRIVVDTIVGASAGSVTGALAAHALLTGRGDDDLQELWVEQTSIQNLLAARPAPGRPRSPLSTTRLERWARTHLTGRGIPPDAEPIAMVVSIANLRGLRYRIAQAEAGRGVAADTFRDARAFVLGPDTNWEPVIEAALASAANAFGFAPVRILRQRSEYPGGIEFEGEQAPFWYTDGGTVYNVPLGFALDAVYDPEGLGLPVRRFPERRLFLLFNPHPTSPPPTWPSVGDPSFRASAARALSLATAQSLFDDLRRAEKTNSRVVTRFQLQNRLQNLLSTDPALAAAVVDMAEWLWARKQEIRTLLGVDPGPATVQERFASAGLTPSPDVMLDFVMDEVTDTRAKDEARIEIVSPDLEAGTVPVSDLIAGEKLLHFFGFVLEEARRSDFALGYRNLRAWWSAFEPGSSIGVPVHPLEETPPGGRLSMADVRPAWQRWWLVTRLAARYVRELVSG